MDVEGVERLRLEKERWARREQQDKERAIEEAKELRDRFAMAALTGLIINNLAQQYTPQDNAEDAYRYADAMLKAREAKP